VTLAVAAAVAAVAAIAAVASDAIAAIDAKVHTHGVTATREIRMRTSWMQE
jgi:hypothetical protein